MTDAAQRESGLGAAFGHGHPAFVGYLMAGYPTRDASLAALRVLAAAGVDLIELGVPFSDPMADGPVIRDAAEVARASHPGGFGLAETIELAEEFIAMAPDAPPVALMTYLNPLMRFGLPAAAAAMRNAGIGGVIVPDLPPDMAAPWLAASAGLDTVFLAAPTSTPERLAMVGERSRGFVYCVSSTGVTGERTTLPAQLTDVITRVRESTRLPVAVGFGVSTPEQAADVARIADGVIVGSALVKHQHDADTLGVVVERLVSAVHGAGSA